MSVTYRSLLCCANPKWKVCRSSTFFEVNGQDLSQATHEEAVGVFQTAEEPIIIEVLRGRKEENRTDLTSRKVVEAVDQLVTTGVQTDWVGVWEVPPLYESQDVFEDYVHSSQDPPCEFEVGLYDIQEAQDDSFDDLYGPEFQEVTLHRDSERDKLGLTLYYSSSEDNDTEVYVSSVAADSVAARTGNIQEGDQILQINGIDVTSKEQAETLFSSSSPDVTVLIFRPQYQDNDGFENGHAPEFPQIQGYEVEDTASAENASNPSHHDSGVGHDSIRNEEFSEHEAQDEDGSTRLVTGTHRSYNSYTSNEFDLSGTNSSGKSAGKKSSSPASTPGDQKPGEVTSSTVILSSDSQQSVTDPFNKKSGVDSGTGSSRGSDKGFKDTIEKDFYLLKRKCENIKLECQAIGLRQRDIGRNRIIESEHIYETIPDDTDEPLYCQPFDMCKQSVLKQPTNDNKPSSPDKKGRSHRHLDVEHWVNTTSQVVCDPQSWTKPVSWGKTSSTNESRSSGDSRGKKKGRRGEEEKSKDSSSAYNTGESSRSNAPELGLILDPKKATRQSTLILYPTGVEERGLQVNLDSDTCSVMSCESCRRCLRLPPLPQSPANIKGGSSPKKDKGSSKRSTPGVTMYTNEANLSHTISLNQQLFLQQIQQVKRPVLGRYPNLSQYQFVSTPPTVHKIPQTSDVDRKKYKVKVRSDGTRYVTSKPNRTKLLKERAVKITQERCGLSTDDDTRSELKMGKYWRKNDRKRHLEQNKERRKRQEAIVRAKMLEDIHIRREMEESRNVDLLNKKNPKKKGLRTEDSSPEIPKFVVPTGKGLLSVTTV